MLNSESLRLLNVERNYTSIPVYSATRGQIETIRKEIDLTIIELLHSKQTFTPLTPDENEYITRIRVPFFPKWERIKSLLFVTKGLNAAGIIRNQFDFNLVHSHFAYVEGLVAKKIAEQYQIPYVITCRGDDLLVYPKNPFIRRKVTDVLTSADRVICVSDYLCGKAIEFGVLPERIHFIPDGVNTDFFNTDYQRSDIRTKHRLQTSDYIMIFVGRLVKEKGIYLLLDAFKEVSTNHQDLRLVVVGSGKENEMIKKFISDHDLSQKIRLTGPLQTPEVAEYVKCADVLVLPSDGEAWGNVIDESLFCGVPVIATRVGGIPELVKNNETGLLIPPGNLSALIQALQFMLQNKEKYKKEIVAFNHFSGMTVDQTAKKVISVYDEIFS
ncbi:MAG: glycosyltransferase [Candidatus Aureabacteria bacterium]|nr:glycosyltransferase [Candidatus Auribacterota bacterium]